MRRLTSRTVASLVIAGALAAVGPPSVTAQTADPVIAGGLGRGRATNVGQVPEGVAVSGERVYVSDLGADIVRMIDVPTGEETVVAGNGDRYDTWSGGEPASSGALHLRDDTAAIAADADGNLYIAEAGWVSKVDPAGIMHRVTGGAFLGPDEGIPAIQAMVAEPRGLAADGAGNLFVSDAYSDRLRKVDPSGVITTVAGTGTEGFSGDGGPATAAAVRDPGALALDGTGNLYVADNGRVRRVTPAGTITTVAGGGPAEAVGDGVPAIGSSLAGPSGLAVDPAGNLLITGGNRVRRVDPSGTITTLSGTGEPGYGGDGGPSTSALLSGPKGLAVDGSGGLYVADRGNHRLRRIDATA